ncbi:MAG TPA: EAL domain-containing protein [Gemmatirosa sp.]|nr:EAL domain-containing protein [Gemmatirosa sp.]
MPRSPSARRPVLIRDRLQRFPLVAGVGFGAVLLVTVVLGVATQRALHRLERGLQPSLELTLQVGARLDAARRAFESAEAVGDRTLLADADSARATVHREVARARTRPGADSLELAALERAYDAYLLAGRYATDLAVAMGADADASIVAASRAWRAREGLRELLDRRSARDRVAIADAFHVARQTQRTMWGGIALVTAAALAVLVALALRLARGIADPLRGAVAAAERIADGDLDVALPEAPDDEMGQLLGALRRTLARLSGTIAELRASEAQLAHQAFHDALTGLANRALFRDRVEHALARGAREGDRRVAVLFLDLDDFKAVNDSLGHDAGDRLLGQVAARLRLATRGCDTVARLGGDEFAILLEDAHGADEATAVADRIAAALCRPVAIVGREVSVGGSIGIALDEPAITADALLRNADIAMYAAKSAGHAAGTVQHRLFDASLLDAVVSRVELERDLARALAREEFHLLYQPIVDLATGRVVSAEALVRWQHPERGLVSPAHFVPVAEGSGHVVALGRWVLEAACREAASWPAVPDGGEVPSVSVNLSGRQLEEASLVADVRDVLAATGLAPARLTLEITESVIMHDTERTLEQLHALKALGVRLAIDDFGTGYSSLSYLQRFPVDVLKIDKSFVDGVARGGHDAALARTIVALGEMLALRTVAEGIEHEAQRAQLAALGCALGQGYLFARPLPAAELRARIVGAAPPLTAARRRGARGRAKATA